MTSEITDKTYVVATRNLGNFWITEKQAQDIKDILQTDIKFIEIEEDLIMVNDIVGVVTGKNIRSLDHKKKGDWICKYNNWHDKGYTCGCANARSNSSL